MKTTGSHKIQAIFEDDLEKVLRDLELYEDVEQGKTRCYFCNAIVTMTNLQFIFAYNDGIEISCNRDSCINRFNRRRPDVVQ